MDGLLIISRFQAHYATPRCNDALSDGIGYRDVARANAILRLSPG